MSDIRDLLRKAVGRPGHQPDVAAMTTAAHQRAQRQRLAIRGGAVAAAVVVVAGSIAAFGGGNDRRVEIPAASSASNADASVTLELPDGWQQLPLVERDDPKELLVVGTAPRPEGQMIDPCFFWGDPNVPAERSAYITIYEYDPQGEIPGSRGAGYEASYDLEHFQARPADFHDATVLVSGDCPVDEHIDPTETNHLREIPFTEDGRLLLAYLVTVGDPDQMLLDETFNVLNTLQIDQTSTSTTSTTSTTLAPDFDQEAAKQQIIDAIVAAHGGVSSVALNDSVEGGHPFANQDDAEDAAAKAEAAQDPSYTAAQEDRISARINSVTFETPTYARVNFDVLADGQLITATTTGYAVFEGANWRIGRATFCEIVARGGYLECPA